VGSQTTFVHDRIQEKVAFVLVIGILVREVFSFWTGHPSDFELWVRLGYAMNHGGNPYGVLPPIPGLSFTNIFSQQNAPTIAYLPFWPLITGIMYAVYSVVGFGNRFVYYFLLKQPVIIGDVALAYLLYAYVRTRNPDRAVWLLLFWLFSPFVIAISGVWGMFDSLAMVFLMFSIMRHKNSQKGFWTGVSVFVKSVPIIYAAVTPIKNLRDTVGPLIAIGVPAILSGVIFFVMRWPIPTVETTLLSTVIKGGSSMSVWGSLTYLNYLGLLPPLTPSVYRVLGFLWIPAVIAFTLVAFRLYRFDTDYGLIQSLIVVTLVFLIFRSRVTEQYSIFLFALVGIDVAVWNPMRKRLVLLMMATATVYLVSNNFLMVRFLAPVYPNFAQFESAISPITPIRNAVNFLSATIFTLLNIQYLIAALKPK
jgi:hypothetical protein